MCKVVVEVREAPLAFTAERAAEFFAARPELNDVIMLEEPQGQEIEEDVEPSVPSFYSSSTVRRGRWNFDRRRANESSRNCGHKAPRWWEGRYCTRKTRKKARETFRGMAPAEHINPLFAIDLGWSMAH